MEVQNEKDAYYKAIESVQALYNVLPDSLRCPSTGVICGSGLGALSNVIQDNLRLEIPYSDIPHFPQSTGKKKCCTCPYLDLNPDSTWSCRKATFWSSC